MKSINLNTRDLLIIKDSLESTIKRKTSVVVGLGNCKFRDNLNLQIKELKETLEHVEKEIYK